MHSKYTRAAKSVVVNLSALAVGSVVLLSATAIAKPVKLGLDGWTLEQALAAEVAVQPFAGRNYAVPGVSGDAANRFRNAASLFTAPRSYPEVSIMVYDYITRCALAGSVVADSSNAGTLRWVRYDGAGSTVAVPGMAGDGLQSLKKFALGRDLADAPDCPTAVARAYKEDPAQIKGAKKLAEHAVSLLAGAQIGSKDAPVSTAAFKRSVQGRVASMGHLEGGELLGAFRDDEITLVILGAPGGQTRFASQYRNLPDGRWQFEGASALGYGLANYMESVR